MNRKHVILISTFVYSFLMTCAISFGQSTENQLAVMGRIVDDETGKPILFVSISIKGKSEGTVTNLDGEFHLYVSDQYTIDTVMVSHIGYESFHFSIQEASKEPNFEIRLIESAITLEEVEVETKRLTGNMIMSEVVENLAKNFSTEPFLFRGFYRDVRDQNNQTSYLVEAAIEAYDYGIQFGKKTKRKNFFLKGVRASNNYIYPLLVRPIIMRQNRLSQHLQYNYWHRRIVNDFKVKKRTYEIENRIFKGERLLFVVTTKGIAAKGNLADQYLDMRFEYVNRYYIDAETYALHKVEYRESPLEGKYVGIERPYEGDTLFYSKKGFNDTYEFEEYDNKMFLKYYEVDYTFDIYNSITNEVFLEMDYNCTFVVTDIVPNADRKPKGVKVNRNANLMLQTEAYDSAFWNIESNAKLVPLTQKQTKGLEREMSLEEQFKSSAKSKK